MLVFSYQDNHPALAFEQRIQQNSIALQLAEHSIDQNVDYGTVSVFMKGSPINVKGGI
jgi:hypothetical protein